MKRGLRVCLTGSVVLGQMVLTACQPANEVAPAQVAAASSKQWLAGDHHVHSHYSMTWDTSVSPPAPILAGDAHYSTPLNATRARDHGLSWMVTTDHGGPNHSKYNLEWAYPELLKSREQIPQVIQFYGMEFDTPGAKHSSLIIPHSADEAAQLQDLEQTYNRREVYPDDPARDEESFMLEALSAMAKQPHPPVLMANHPGRTATDLGRYTKVTPEELRNWNDTAPDVAVGMEGSPGHQAAALNPDGTVNPDTTRARGGYDDFPTMGGFDQMTARLGGFWDSMLGEGRHWWITSNSDSHVHYSDGRTDFWPGEYAKTYVYAEKSYDDILQNIRGGHIFVTTGDLIDGLFVRVSVAGKQGQANIGDTLRVKSGDSLHVSIEFHQPAKANFNDQLPRLARVDLIGGLVTGRVADKAIDSNPSTSVLGRFYPQNWQNKTKTEQGYWRLEIELAKVTASQYLRVRGTNTQQTEPQPDTKGEDPWDDLWFYSNPVFIQVME